MGDGRWKRSRVGDHLRVPIKLLQVVFVRNMTTAAAFFVSAGEGLLFVSLFLTCGTFAMRGKTENSETSGK
jgi:hypothetical protein